MKVKNLEHVGIAVKNTDDTVRFYTDVLGIEPGNIQTSVVPGQVKLTVINIGKGQIELLENLNPKSPPVEADNIAHMAIEVEDIEGTLAQLKSKGATLIHEKPMVLPSGRKVAFVVPAGSRVSIELVED